MRQRIARLAHVSRPVRDETPSAQDAVRIVIVCHANVTRSVVAGRLLERGMPAGTTPLELRTRGTHVLDGQPVSPRTREAVRRVIGEELGLGDHAARQLDAEDVAWADLIITMEASQTRLIAKQHPAAIRRTATLGFLASCLPAGPRPIANRLAELPLTQAALDASYDVDDPAGLGDDAYVAVVRELVAKCEALVERL